MSKISYEELKKYVRLEMYKEISTEYETLINEAIDNRWKIIESNYNGSDLDPADECSEDVEMLRNFKYRMTLMIICCLCETWEQDLYNFLKENNFIQSTNNCFNMLKNELRDALNIDLDSNKYKKLKEMRDLVNGIKHGNGPSLNRVIEEYGSDILANSNLGMINEDGTEEMIKQRHFDDNILTSITLKCDGKTKEYYQALIDFWNDVFNEIDCRN